MNSSNPSNSVSGVSGINITDIVTPTTTNQSIDVLLQYASTPRQREILQAYIDNGFSKAKAGRALGVDESVIRVAIKKVRKYMEDSQNPYAKVSQTGIHKSANSIKAEEIPMSADEFVSPDKRTIHKLSEENKHLKKLLQDTKNKVFGSSDINELIHGVKEIGFDSIPKWIEKDSSTNDSLVPVLFLTDLHIGEVVNSKEIGYIEDYNTEICKDSTNQLTEDFIDICCNKMSNYNYEGVVLLLGGDGLNGDIHGMMETNDTTPIRQIIDLTSLYIQQIEKLKASFGKVLVVGVSGNHSRYDFRHNGAKTKLRTETSMETIVYHFVHQHFEQDKNVSIVFNQADEVLFAINGRRFNLQHGDRGIKGGGGIGGVITAVKRARAKLLQAAVSMNKAFDTLIIGHFHTHFIADDIIIGASTKPYDEYCKSMGFAYNEAGATMFFVNTHGDIIYATHLKVRQNKTVTIRDKSIELF